MKTRRPSSFRFALAVLITVGALVCHGQAATTPATKPATKTPAPKVTTETSRIGPATDKVVVTEKYRDGTVIRVVQIVHKDGTAETSGDRNVTPVKS